MVLAEGAIAIRILKWQGLSVREIAWRTGLSRNTVKRYLESTEDPVYTARPAVVGKPDAHMVFLSERVAAAHPDRFPATVLLNELRLRGYTGGITILRDYFGSWDQALPSNAVLTAAILDRLKHHATLVQIGGDSYRLRDKRKGGVLPKPAHQPPSQAAVPDMAAATP